MQLLGKTAFAITNLKNFRCLYLVCIRMGPSAIDGGGVQRAYSSLLNYLLLIDSRREGVIAFSFFCTNDPTSSQLIVPIQMLSQMSLAKVNESQNKTKSRNPGKVIGRIRERSIGGGRKEEDRRVWGDNATRIH